MKPVLKTSTVDLLGEEVGGRDLDQNEERVLVAMADFYGEADGSEGLDKLDEPGFGSGAF